MFLFHPVGFLQLSHWYDPTGSLAQGGNDGVAGTENIDDHGQTPGLAGSFNAAFNLYFHVVLFVPLTANICHLFGCTWVAQEFCSQDGKPFHARSLDLLLNESFFLYFCISITTAAL
jgi:hypothetical protein